MEGGGLQLLRRMLSWVETPHVIYQLPRNVTDEDLGQLADIYFAGQQPCVLVAPEHGGRTNSTTMNENTHQRQTKLAKCKERGGKTVGGEQEDVEEEEAAAATEEEEEEEEEGLLVANTASARPSSAGPGTKLRPLLLLLRRRLLPPCCLKPRGSTSI